MRRSKEQKFQASANQVGKLMRLFDDTIGAIQTAVDEDRDPFDVIQDTVGWWTLLKVRDQVSSLGELADEDPLIAASRRYTYLRRFVPAFLDAFDFRSASAGKSLLRAVDLWRVQNGTGKRKLPDELTMPFPARHWRRLIEVDGSPNRHRYETAVVSTLRDQLRAGDVWVEGTRSYRRFDAYLLSVEAARDTLADTDLNRNAVLQLNNRRAIIFWNTKQIAATVDQLRSARVGIDENLLQHVSPLGWAHIILTGDYFWDRQSEKGASLADVVTRKGTKR